MKKDKKNQKKKKLKNVLLNQKYHLKNKLIFQFGNVQMNIKKLLEKEKKHQMIKLKKNVHLNQILIKYFFNN